MGRFILILFGEEFRLANTFGDSPRLGLPRAPAVLHIWGCVPLHSPNNLFFFFSPTRGSCLPAESPSSQGAHAWAIAPKTRFYPWQGLAAAFPPTRHRAVLCKGCAPPLALGGKDEPHSLSPSSPPGRMRHSWNTLVEGNRGAEVCCRDAGRRRA